MSRRQIRLIDSYSGSFFLPQSYGYKPASEPKSALNQSNFRFGPYRPTGSGETFAKKLFGSSISSEKRQIGRTRIEDHPTSPMGQQLLTAALNINVKQALKKS